MNAYQICHGIPKGADRVLDVFFNGKGGRFYDSSKDMAKIDVLSRLFDDKVRYFEENSGEEPKTVKIEQPSVFGKMRPVRKRCSVGPHRTVLGQPDSFP